MKEYRDEAQGFVVRAVEIGGETWIVAKDVADILEIENSSQAVSRLEKFRGFSVDSHSLSLYDKRDRTSCMKSNPPDTETLESPEPRQARSMQRLVLRIEALECKVASLERMVGGDGGFRCEHCETVRPADWFLYEAFNPETKQSIKPLCGPCVQRSAVGGLPWKYHGPYRQNAL